MALLRLALPAALVLAGFVPVTVAVAQSPVEWYSDTGGGGVLAQPAPKAHNGGAAAPLTATGPVDLPESDISATPPVSHAARAEPVPGTPTRDLAPAREESPSPRAAQDAPTVTGGDNQQAGDAGPIGSLPLTGLQLAGVAGAGLFLLLAGAALRPRRRTPAPR